MKKLYILFSGILLFLTGCTESEPENLQSQVAEESKEISKLKEELGLLKDQLNDTQKNMEILEQMIMSHDGLGYGELRRQQQMLDDLIVHLPDIEIRTGFIREAENDFISIDFAEKVESPDAPNGFEIINDKEEAESFPIAEELTLFVLNGTDMEVRTIGEFNPSRQFFFEFYISNGHVIQVRELYIP
ncbi:hypothetical protein ACFOZY_10500 [Chungangia koreensis]|uniref:Lipoprotein n=1 Tax=Chungangia koreensis TaxID=752657 RepID=A0ABV8X7B0_9LACT